MEAAQAPEREATTESTRDRFVGGDCTVRNRLKPRQYTDTPGSPGAGYTALCLRGSPWEGAKEQGNLVW